MVETKFKAAIAERGLIPPGTVIADGEIHRFGADGKPGKKNGWYFLYADNLPTGGFGCWSSGISVKWSGRSVDSLSPDERRAYQKRMEALRLKQDVARLNRQNEAAQDAKLRWQNAQLVTEHLYLQTRGVKSHGLRQDGDYLLVPLRDENGAIHSLQTISADGEKRFEAGGRIEGCYYAIGKPENVLVICEGYATGASIFESTGHAVAVAFNAGNLKSVAQVLRGKYASIRLILAADDDWRTDGNPGLAKAKEAALAVGGLIAVPTFPCDRPDKATDFNDLHQLAGVDAVRACIESAEGGISDWPEPTPLPDALPPVAAFEPDLLPEALRDWVADIAHRMQCPVDFTAVGAVVAISSLIGARAVVAPKAEDDWTVVPNQWGQLVGNPGTWKSPALHEVLRFIRRLEDAERKVHQARHDEWRIESDLDRLKADGNRNEAKKFAAKDRDKARLLLAPVESSPEPVARRYMVNDATVEKLQEILVDHPWGLLVFRDELHGLICQMDRPGQEGSRGFYLTGYDGKSGYTTDRVIRGTNHIPRVCLAMLGSIQPGKIQSHIREAVNGGAGDDGLLQRFGLTVWPDINPDFNYVDRKPDDEAQKRAEAVFNRLNDLTPTWEEKPRVWRFSPQAQAMFEKWLVPFMTELRGGELHPALVSHLSKYTKLIPALALIFTLVDAPDSGRVIHERELARALDWGDYLRSHAERLYSAAVRPDTHGAKQLLDKIKDGKLCGADGVIWQTFTPRLIAAKHWTGLGTPDAVRKASDLLVEYGWLIREAVPTGAAGGRPSDRYRIHAKLLKGGR